MPDKTPQERLAVSHPPGSWFSDRALDSSLALFPSFPVIASIPVDHNLVVPTVLDSSLVPFPSFLFGASLAVYHYRAVPTSGAPWGFPSSLTLLFLHATACGLRRTSTSSPFRRLLCCLRCTLKPSASATNLSRSCTSTSGRASPLRPTGFSVYASPVLFAAFRRLRHGRKTRYGWVAGPYPTGTLTLQETPSLSRRDNASSSAAGVARSAAALG